MKKFCFFVNTHLDCRVHPLKDLIHEPEGETIIIIE